MATSIKEMNSLLTLPRTLMFSSTRNLTTRVTDFLGDPRGEMQRGTGRSEGEGERGQDEERDSPRETREKL